MNILPLIFVLVVVAGLASAACAPAVQAQSPRFEYAPHYWKKEQSTGLPVRRGYNNLAPLALQNVPSGKTVSVQSMTGVDFAKLPKYKTTTTTTASGRPLPAKQVAANSGFGKPNAQTAASANSLRPGVPTTASPVMAANQRALDRKSVSNKIRRNGSGRQIAKQPGALNYPQGVGFIPGSTAPALYGVNTKARTSVGGILLPRH